MGFADDVRRVIVASAQKATRKTQPAHLFVGGCNGIAPRLLALSVRVDEGELEPSAAAAGADARGAERCLPRA